MRLPIDNKITEEEIKKAIEVLEKSNDIGKKKRNKDYLAIIGTPYGFVEIKENDKNPVRGNKKAKRWLANLLN